MVYDWIEWMSGICFHSNPGWPLGVMMKPVAMKGWHHDIYIEISNRCNAFTKEHGGCKRPRIGDIKSINCGFTEEKLYVT